MKRPWMPLYTADFLKDTTHVGALISGAYMGLIMHYWNNGCLPDDEAQLTLIAKLTAREWSKSRDILKAFFYDGWKHKRIDSELAHAVDISNKRSKIASARQAAIREQEQCKDSAIAPANAPTLHTSHSTKKEERGSADAPPEEIVVPIRPLAFSGHIVRLDHAQLEKWRKSFFHLPDITATLQVIDDYYRENLPADGKWFFRASNWLQKEHSRLAAEIERLRLEARSF